MTRGDDRRDPLIALRIPAPLKKRLYAEADARATTVSEIVRTSIEATLNNGKQTTGHQKPRAACEHRVRQGAYCRRCQGII